eukprot:1672651-Pleurochrysis_carterae.AAC.1
MAGSPVPSSAALPRITQLSVIVGRGTRVNAAYAETPGALRSAARHRCRRTRMAPSQVIGVSGPRPSSWSSRRGRQRPRMRYVPPPTMKTRLCRKKTVRR